MIRKAGDEVMECVRIAQFGDIHLSFDGAVFPPIGLKEVRLKRALSMSSWVLKRSRHYRREIADVVMEDVVAAGPDIFACVGDVTNFGLESEFVAFADWFRSKGLPEGLLVPGNHDAMVSESHVRKRLALRPWLGSKVLQPQRVSVMVRDRVALVGVNTACPTGPFQAWGVIGRSERESLRQTLVELGRRGLCRVVVMHHPPLPGERSRGLRCWQDFRNIVNECGAELVLYGHEHERSLSRIPMTSVSVLGCPSASRLWKRGAGTEDKVRRMRFNPGWNLITISDVGTGWKVDVEARSFDGDRWESECGRTHVVNKEDGLPDVSSSDA